MPYIHSFLCILLIVGEAEGSWNMLIMPSDCINISLSSEILGPQILSLKIASQKKTLCDLSKKIPNHRNKLLFDSTSLPYKNLQASKNSSCFSSWWLNQPLWKILIKIGSFPQVGVKIENIWVATTEARFLFFLGGGGNRLARPQLFGPRSQLRIHDLITHKTSGGPFRAVATPTRGVECLRKGNQGWIVTWYHWFCSWG